MTSSEFQSPLRFDSLAIILSGATLSNAIDLHGTALVGLSFPSNFSGTQVAVYSATSLTGTYQAVKNVDGSAATLECGASVNVALVPFDLASVRYIKFLSNTAQSADCSITLVTRPV